MSLTGAAPRLKWPRTLESDPRLPALEALLESRQSALWAQGEIKVTEVTATPALQELIPSLQGRGQIERGLENITKILASEKYGQEALRSKEGTLPAYRVSRILLMANTGSERFNRDCEKLLKDHAERVLGLKLDESGSALMENLYGAETQAKALLISHRDAVAQTLMALLPS